MSFDELIGEIREIAEDSLPLDTKLFEITRAIKECLRNYDWVGFYLVDDEAKNELRLGPFSGAATEHGSIPFGTGVCGMVAESKETLVIDDVASEANYLSCSIDVKSEIVLPIFADSEFKGVLDIDSHTSSRFTARDREFLEQVVGIVSGLLANYQRAKTRD